MMDCQAVIEKLFDYLDKEMNAEEMAHLKSHLDLCRDCFDRAQFEQLLRDEVKKKTHHCCPESVKNKILKILDKF